MSVNKQQKITVKNWVRSGDPFIWLNAAAVSVSVVAVIGLLILLAVRGFGHFWPADVQQVTFTMPGEPSAVIIGERVETEEVPVEQII